MKIAYPIIYKQNNSYYLIYIPDFDGFTEAEHLDIAEVMEMARDYISDCYVMLENNNEAIPEPSNYEQAVLIAKERADSDDFLFSDGELTYVDIDKDTTTYRELLERLNNGTIK